MNTLVLRPEECNDLFPCDMHMMRQLLGLLEFWNAREPSGFHCLCFSSTDIGAVSLPSYLTYVSGFLHSLLFLLDYAFLCNIVLS